MWYFSWVLGVSLAVSFAIINALWQEQQSFMDAGDPEDRSDGHGA
ncbi:cytochrome bd-I oxidase subunit CydX [Beijerinckiaceae bacterium]|nr:cytochrome bd-I oxidase subunit CydX [Beijerinckiaceae bacterium]